MRECTDPNMKKSNHRKLSRSSNSSGRVVVNGSGGGGDGGAGLANPPL